MRHPALVQFVRRVQEAREDTDWLVEQVRAALIDLGSSTPQLEIEFRQQRIQTVLQFTPKIIEQVEEWSIGSARMLVTLHKDMLQAIEGLQRFLMGLSTLEMPDATREVVDQQILIVGGVLDAIKNRKPTEPPMELSHDLFPHNDRDRLYRRS